MFKNPFSSDGRIRRLEYGLSYVIYILAIFIIVLINEELADPDQAITSFLMLLLWIPLLWFLYAQGAKRCHDRDHSGWWQFIPGYVLWMMFAPGDVGRNNYGPNPKGIDFDLGDDEYDDSVRPVDDVDGDGIIIGSK